MGGRAEDTVVASAVSKETLRVLVLGKAGAGKSTMVNKLTGQRDKSKAAPVGDLKRAGDFSGVTKECKGYMGTLKMGTSERPIVAYDGPGLGDHEITFPKLIRTLTGDDTHTGDDAGDGKHTGDDAVGGILCRNFDVVVVCNKEQSRNEESTRKLIQILDVCNKSCGDDKWGNVIICGVCADAWTWKRVPEDSDGEEEDVDALEAFDSLCDTIVEDARGLGAETCQLNHRAVVTAKPDKSNPAAQYVSGFKSLKEMLMKWDSYDGVQFRPFDVKLLAERWRRITGAIEIEADAAWAQQITNFMMTMEVGRAYEDLRGEEGPYTIYKKRLLGIDPGKNKAGLDFYLNTLQAAKKRVQEGHAWSLGWKGAGVGGGVAGAGAAAACAAFAIPVLNVAALGLAATGGVLGLIGAGTSAYTSSESKGTLAECLASSVKEIEAFEACKRRLRTAMDRCARALQAVTGLVEEEACLRQGVAGDSAEAVSGATALASVLSGGYAGFRLGELASLSGSGYYMTAVGAAKLAGAASVGVLVSTVDLIYSLNQGPPTLGEIDKAINEIERTKQTVDKETKAFDEDLRLLSLEYAKARELLDKMQEKVRKERETARQAVVAQ